MHLKTFCPEVLFYTIKPIGQDGCHLLTLSSKLSGKSKLNRILVNTYLCFLFWTMKFSVCSLNVRGLNSDISKENLATDLDKYKGDVLCLQETKIANGADINIQDQRLLCFQSDSRHYGNGFLLNEYWSEKVHRTWKVNDRICVLQLDVSETFKNEDKIKLISIINVYGPTSRKRPRRTRFFL